MLEDFSLTPNTNISKNTAVTTSSAEGESILARIAKTGNQSHGPAGSGSTPCEAAKSGEEPNRALGLRSRLSSRMSSRIYEAYKKHVEKLRNRPLAEKNESQKRDNKLDSQKTKVCSIQPETNKVRRGKMGANVKRTKLVMEPIHTYKIPIKKKVQQEETPKPSLPTKIDTECQKESLPKDIIIQTSGNFQQDAPNPWDSPKRDPNLQPTEKSNDISPLRDPSLDGLEETRSIRWGLSSKNMFIDFGYPISDAKMATRYTPSRTFVGSSLQEASTMLDWPYLPVSKTYSHLRINIQQRPSLSSENNDPRGRSKTKGNSGPIRPIKPYEARHPSVWKKNRTPHPPPIDYGSV